MRNLLEMFSMQYERNLMETIGGETFKRKVNALTNQINKIVQGQLLG